MNAAQRRAYRMYLWATVLYLGTLLIAVYLSRHFKAWPGKPLFMLLPLAAVVLMLRGMMLYFTSADEMQRRILSEGSAYAFATIIFASIVYGLFEGSVIPPAPWWAQFTFMMTVWGFAVEITKRRYK
ncbi:MAG TPA: hypothetical protein VGL89_14245 [Candidatus Koribacter sp.]